MKILVGLILATGITSALPARAASHEPQLPLAQTEIYQKLAHAVIQNQVNEVRKILHEGYDPNVRVKLPEEDSWAADAENDPEPPLLLLASRFGSPGSEIVHLLLDHGANVHVRDRLGRTPLMKAAQLGWMPSMEPLMEKGANVNARDKAGMTVLMAAMGNRNLGAVAKLIDKGADVNARDKAGQTPLMYAVLSAQHDPILLYRQKEDTKATQARYLELLQYLIEKGAKADAKDKQEETALSLAEQKGQKEAAQLIRDALKKPAKPKMKINGKNEAAKSLITG